MYHREHHTQQQGLTLREKLAWSLAGIILLGGTVILVRNTVRKRQAEQQQRLTYQDGSAATYAKQIKMAFDNDGWWGTNTAGLRAAIVRIPTKQSFRDVMDSYRKMYQRSMLADMESELQASEYNEMLSIIAAKPERHNTGGAVAITIQHLQGWAGRLKAAFEKRYGFLPGTDEDAIRAVFMEMPTQAAFMQTASVYRSIYGRDLSADLRGELEFWEYQPYMQIISQKPKQ